jgi:putative tryptophan/tyrosine transport system substrate-binding protein
MRRRELLRLLGGAAAAWPFTARAQQPVVPVVGYLHPGSPESNAHRVAAFRDGLSETGYFEGRNVAIDFRWARGPKDRLQDLAADLVRRGVAVIAVPGSTLAALAAKAATVEIPIVFGIGSDPIQEGLVASINRPGGNITGVSWLSGEIGAKGLGLLHDLLPRAARLAVLVDPNSPVSQAFAANVRAAAAHIGAQIRLLTATTNRDIDAAFASLGQEPADAILVSPDTLFNDRRLQIVTLAAHRAVPAIYSHRDFPEIGGLMSYGANRGDAAREVGVYTGRILKGEKPADLPILQPTKFELVINLMTAKALGLDVPASVLAIANEVIE